MPTVAEQCTNHEINNRMCPCVNLECGNHGICCECLQAHAGGNSLTACMRGAKRGAETLALARQAAVTCATNQERNQAICACTYEPCGRKGVCCNCVRNHFNADGTGRVACMQF